MSGQKAKGSKKGRKHGRNKLFCAQYAARGTETKNRERKVRRHLKSHPRDTQAVRLLVNQG